MAPVYRAATPFPFSKLGPAVRDPFVSSLALLCSRCHHDLHLGRYTITHTPHGLPEIHPTRAPSAA